MTGLVLLLVVTSVQLVLPVRAHELLNDVNQDFFDTEQP